MIYPAHMTEKWEVDGCTECHEQHENPLVDLGTCAKCAETIKDVADHVTFEFHFTVEDVAIAQAWAQKKGYRYDSVEHLLHDALIEKVIQTDNWKAA